MLKHLNIKQFTLAVCKLANTLSYGTDTSPFLGTGTEYVQSRLYQDGDPVKLIDWKTTAKTGKYYIKEFESTKQMPIYFVLDTSASMYFSQTPLSKQALAIQIAMGLSLVALKRMSPVGIITAGSRELHVKPTLSKNNIFLWGYQLHNFDPKESTSLTSKLHNLRAMLKKRTLVIIISDLHDKGTIDAIKLLHQEHDMIVIDIHDPAEKGKIGGGIFRGQEAESEKNFVAHGYTKWLEIEKRTEDLNHAGIDNIQLWTDQAVAYKLRFF